MVVTVGTEMIRVRFNYYTDGGKRCALAIVERLTSKDEWALRSKGIAKCSLQDNFTRSSGRRIALTRALEFESRKFRTHVWRGLFMRGMKP